MLKCRQKWFALVMGSFLIGMVAFGSCVSKSGEGVPEVLPSQLRPELGHQRVVFLDRNPGGNRLYIVRIDSSEFITLTSDVGMVAGPSLSLDGSRVVYNCGNDLCLMDIEEKSERRLVDISEQMPGAVRAMAPRFAPDGRQVVFTGGFSDAVELFLVDTDNGDLAQISDGGYNHFASFSPDGRQITFKCEGEPAIPSQICVMNVDGTGKTRVTDANLTYGKPVYTPDGKHILVSAHGRSFLRSMFGQTKPFNLHLISIDDLKLRQIVSDEREFAVTFSTDGREIVYLTSDKDTGYTTGIYAINFDGSNKRRLGDDWWDIARRGGGLSE